MGDVVGGRLELDARPEALAGAVEPPTTETSRSQARRRTSRLQFWRSPDDQPRWARPALLTIAALAALAYGWGMNGAALETFYAGAVRSMSQSWHNFFFGAFDPWGTVSIDKLPGAFWVQALSVRLFGFHVWAFVLPQVVEGTLTVLVLYRAVRRVAGSGAGLLAAAALAVTPVTILLNRGNISDSLLILLLVLAADATTDAFMSGRLRPLVLAGVWVGLAFQAKMLQAWLVLPALYIAYLMAAPGPQPGPPLWAHRRFRRRGARRLPQLDVRRRPRPGPRPAVRRRQLQQLGVQPGVPLQRRRSPEWKGARAAGVLPAARRHDDRVHGRRRPDCGTEQGPGEIPRRPARPRRRLALHPGHGRVGRHPDRPPAPAAHRSLARRRRAVGFVVGPHVVLLRRLPVPERLLPGRTGATDGGTLWPRSRPRLADLARQSQRARRPRPLRGNGHRRRRRSPVPRSTQRRCVAVGTGDNRRTDRARRGLSGHSACAGLRRRGPPPLPSRWAPPRCSSVQRGHRARPSRTGWVPSTRPTSRRR